MSARRIFWGKTLPQAVAKAARHHAISPDELAWRRHEKRHGFVRHPRAILIEVDPTAPKRADGVRAAEPAGAARDAGERAATPAAPANPSRQSPAPVARPGSGAGDGGSPPRRPVADRAGRPARIVAPRNEEPYETPDEAAEQAAHEAVARLLRLVGAGLEARFARDRERVTIALSGADDQALDLELLDDLEHLLPRSIFALSGRRVRVGVDCNGQREARAEELRRLARGIAERVRATGDAETLPLLPANERRIVHQLFEVDSELVTESLGDGALKRLRIARRAAAPLS